MPEEEKKLVGQIAHYFGKIGVAVIELKDGLEVGDEISIEGPNTNFKQKVDSMEVEHKKLEKAKKGMDVGLKVIDKVHEKDQVFKVMA